MDVSKVDLVMDVVVRLDVLLRFMEQMPTVSGVVAVLASIGLATLAHILWTTLKPILGYLCSGPRQTMSFWLYALGLFGGGAFGYGIGGLPGMWATTGIMSLALSLLTLSCYHMRLWVKWAYNEKE